jgi:hypothetical protein
MIDGGGGAYASLRVEAEENDEWPMEEGAGFSYTESHQAMMPRLPVANRVEARFTPLNASTPSPFLSFTK